MKKVICDFEPRIPHEQNECCENPSEVLYGSGEQKAPSVKGHLWVSVFKSSLRMIGFATILAPIIAQRFYNLENSGPVLNCWMIGLIIVIIAEILGVVEEFA